MKLKEKLVPKDALSGITAHTEQQKQHVLPFTCVKWCQNLFTCFTVGLKKKSCLSLFKYDLLVWVNNAVIVLL